MDGKAWQPWAGWRQTRRTSCQVWKATPMGLLAGRKGMTLHNAQLAAARWCGRACRARMSVATIGRLPGSRRRMQGSETQKGRSGAGARPMCPVIARPAKGEGPKQAAPSLPASCLHPALPTSHHTPCRSPVPPSPSWLCRPEQAWHGALGTRSCCLSKPAPSHPQLPLGSLCCLHSQVRAPLL